MKVILLPVCLVVCVAVCFGQSNKVAHPDLSGTWEFDSGHKNVAVKSKNSPEQIKIIQHDPELIIRRQVIVDGVTEDRDVTYYTDGRGERTPTPDWITTNSASDFKPFETASQTTWRKDKFVIRSVTRIHAGKAIIESEMIYELRLSSDGKRLTMTTRFLSMREVSTNVPFIIGGRDLETVYKLISK